MIKFANPLYFLLLIPVISLFFFQRKKKRLTTIQYSNTQDFKQLENKKTNYIVSFTYYLRFGLLILLIIALARPQSILTLIDDESIGIDIMLALDTSSSMNAEDFKPDNRFIVAKKTIQSFIKKRVTDRIGLVVFGEDAFTQCPLTLDYGVLNSFLSDCKTEMAGQGTAVGMAIATSLNRLKKSKAKSKIIILLTDGVNNAGKIDPISAAKIAQNLGIKIYTIGVGKEGGARIPIMHPKLGKIYARNPDGSYYMTEIDEGSLKDIAKITNGLYFRATDEKALSNIYDQIDKLEKTKVKSKKHFSYTDYFPKIIGLILFILCLEIFISNILIILIP
jgi:Ca-activated chloride channel homolog